MIVDIDLQIACDGVLPSEQDFANWVGAALTAGNWDEEIVPQLTIRLVDTEEGTELNRIWRHKDGPTNVLSFPFETMPGVDIPLLGDIVICAPVVRSEAQAQNKTETAHWAHLVIHGSLHLLGYDHIEEQEAVEMEQLETQILQELGYPDPYQEH